MKRRGSISRKTKETNITVNLILDGNGVLQGSSSIPVFDHFLQQLAGHGLLELELEVSGDLEIDNHHTIEDLGICLGQAFRQALGDKKGINRYGSAQIPMDDALVEVVLDFSGRPYLAYGLKLLREQIGSLETELVEEFLRAFAINSGLTLHVRQLAGHNCHHLAEALFKALGRAVREAVSLDPRVKGIPSSKGILA